MGFFSFLVVAVTWANTVQLAKYDPQRDSQDFARLQTVVNEQRFANPESFLTEWKKLKPEYFSNYVLAYRSRSLQKSSPSHPRALIFNKNADLVIAFNGHREHKGFNNLEMMHFNHDAKAFEFFEMSFQNNRAVLSQPNPKKCLACHQSAARANVDPRPNWEPYNTWLGFYGSIDDSTDLMKSGFEREPEYDPAQDAMLLPEFDSETQWHTDFRLYTQPTHPRYSLLSPSTTDEYGRPGQTLNGDLTNRLTVLNFKRVARLIREQPREIYEYVKWPVWAHANCSLDLFMSDDIFEWLYQLVPNKDYARRKYRRRETPVAVGGRFDDYKPSPPAKLDYINADATDVINIFFESVGVRTEDWSMDFKTDGGRFAAFERFGTTNDPRPPWEEAIKNELNKDPELAGVDCESAKKESRKRFTDIAPTKKWVAQMQTLYPRSAEKPLLDRCIGCHTRTRVSDDETPVIPFEDSAQLKRLLTSGGYKHGTLFDEIRYRLGPHAGEDEQMPKGGVPTTRQKQDFLNYLESL